MKNAGLVGVAVALVSTGLLAGTASAQSFSAKSVNLVVGFPPGGGYDTIARVFSRHYGKHLPGTPAIVVQNQPGAGSLLAANVLYNAGAKDGSQMAMFASSAVLEPLMDNPQAKFDPNKFEWVGNLNRDTPACGVWKTSGLTSWDDIKKRKTRFGASGPAAVTAQHAFFLKNVGGADIQVIMGLGGTGPIVLAMQRGEVDASCGMFLSSVRGSFRQDYEAGNLNIFVQFGKKKIPYFKNAPSIYELLSNEDDKKLAEFVFAPAEVTRPIALPPGTPASIVKAMQDAFDKTVADKEYLADMAKAQIDAEPMTGAETAASFKSITSSPKALVERAKAVLTPPK
jgi:tripartite-type tricarboxylate transporter receptor subunit TctC